MGHDGRAELNQARLLRDARVARSEQRGPRRLPEFPAEDWIHRMLSHLHGFLRDESGEDLIEYGLLASFVAAVAMATFILDPLSIKPSLVAAYRKAATALFMAAQGDVVQL